MHGREGGDGKDTGEGKSGRGKSFCMRASASASALLPGDPKIFTLFSRAHGIFFPCLFMFFSFSFLSSTSFFLHAGKVKTTRLINLNQVTQAPIR